MYKRQIQGGDPNGDGTGSAKISDLKDGGEETAYSIKGEAEIDNSALTGESELINVKDVYKRQD